jgi:hypothetical protein
MHLTLINLITVQTTLVQKAWNSNVSFLLKNQCNLIIRQIRDSDKMNEMQNFIPQSTES